MAIVRSEFALALNQVATERGISPEDVVESIEAAILAAYKKEYLHDEEISDELHVKVSMDTGETHLFEGEKDITPPGFGRIAFQTAKQVIFQKIREVEKKTITTQYKSQVGTLIKGRVIRYDGHSAYVDIGKAEALLPRDEQIRNMSYSVNTTHLFYLKEIVDDKYGHSRIIISHTDPNLVQELFKREVPEISGGTVEVKKVVREPGERAKIAVHSSQGGVDPVGACVGQKGIRVQTVTDELGGHEKIDIIQWNSDEKVFITSALSPARVQSVEIDEDRKMAKVTVEESQAPLAIGRSGVNVNLAAKLTGYEIDIVQVTSEDSSTEQKAENDEEDTTAQDEQSDSETKQKAESNHIDETDEAKEDSENEEKEKTAVEEKNA